MYLINFSSNTEEMFASADRIKIAGSGVCVCLLVGSRLLLCGTALVFYVQAAAGQVWGRALSETASSIESGFLMTRDHDVYVSVLKQTQVQPAECHLLK
jgi:hypothetical protein